MRLFDHKDDLSSAGVEKEDLGHLAVGSRLLLAAIESAANAIFITDRDGRIQWVNAGFERLTGYTLAEAGGRTPALLRSGRHHPAFYADLWSTILAGKVWQGRVTNRHKDGTLYTAEQTITPMRGASGEIEHFVAVHEDITARLASEERVAHMALHDSLTDLPNRYALDHRLDLELSRARRRGTRVAVLCVDLDNFKNVNDMFGHAVGDALLVAVGRRLDNLVRDCDLVGRLGGDEFAIVMPDTDGRGGAGQVAERLVASCQTPYRIGDHEIFVSASIGVAVTGAETVDQAALLKRADLALYRAKSEGRNAYRLYEREMDAEVRHRMRLAHDLHRAVGGGELFLEYQPQVSLGDRRIVGVEALVRWRHPDLGVVSPTEFIPVAETCGLIEGIGAWVLRAVCVQARAWHESGMPPIPLAVNVSAAQLRNPAFVDAVIDLLGEFDLAPAALELELTERVLMDASPVIDESLAALDALGIGISLDDFGRGYASLDYLRRYPLSKVKIDRSYVLDMETDAKNATIVGAVIELAGKLGLAVVAEGVELRELHDRLAAQGCGQVQGFYYSRPVPPAEVERLFAAGSERIRGRAPAAS